MRSIRSRSADRLSFAHAVGRSAGITDEWASQSEQRAGGIGSGTAFSLTAEEIARALSTAQPPKMRGEVFDFAAGFTVIDDSYNSIRVRC